jgi:small subunit ribosomal protein S1
MQNYDDIIKSGEFKQMPKVGDLVDGKVASISRGEIYLDIDGIFTGIIRGKEIQDESDRFSDLKIGDSAIATVLEMENEKGVMELSFRSAGHQKAWQELKNLLEKGEITEVKILDVNKGGLIAQLNNINGFLPVSQLSSENYPRVEGGNKNKILEKLRSFIGKKIKVKVIDVNEKEDKLIVSEKDVFAEARKELVGKFAVGDIVEGTITSLVDFGAFMEFFKPEDSENKLEGLVHISELAWQRIDHPKSIFKTGDKVKAQIISIENGRISLSVKRLSEDPWKKAVEKYTIGDKVSGKVIKTDKFGAFVELDSDIQGLAHISELSNDEVKNIDEIVKVGESYEFTIVSLEPTEHRLGLSLISENKKDVSEEKKEENVVEEKSEENIEVISNK